MRLIDADKLNELLREEVNNDITFKFIADSFTSIIDAMPTAYDVDKVVEEINEESWEYMSDFQDSRVISTVEVIDIIRRGGVE